MQLVTHNARFHYDEILATAILRKIFPSAEIVRTRDQNLIDAGDIVYDVGGVYDPATNRFDHHQHSFNETYSGDYDIKLSSAGLVWKHYHARFLSTYGVSEDGSLYKRLVDKIYADFFLGADANDNGYDIHGEIKPRTIYAMVNLYNDGDSPYSKRQTENFYKALAMVSDDLDRYISDVLASWYYKYKELCGIMKDLDDFIIVTDAYYDCSVILDVEKDLNKNIFYEVYPSGDQYKIRAINVDYKNFSLKKPLKQEWRGKREEELKDLIEGGVFVHASGFIGVNKTKEGAIRMCRISYNEE